MKHIPTLALLTLSLNAFGAGGSSATPADLPSFSGSYSLTKGHGSCVGNLKINASGSSLLVESNNKSRHPSFTGIDKAQTLSGKRFVGQSYGDLRADGQGFSHVTDLYMNASVETFSAGKTSVKETFSGKHLGKNIKGERTLKLKSGGNELRYTIKVGYKEGVNSLESNPGSISIGVSHVTVLDSTCTYKRNSSY